MWAAIKAPTQGGASITVRAQGHYWEGITVRAQGHYWEGITGRAQGHYWEGITGRAWRASCPGMLVYLMPSHHVLGL